jgi:hypothetical protein
MTTSMKTEVFNPTRQVRVQSGTWEVRELLWRDYLATVKRMADLILRFVSDGGGGKYSLIFEADKLIAGIADTEGLAEWLIAKSTGKPKEDIEALTASEALSLLAAVVDLNLSDELIASGKALAGRVRAVFNQHSAPSAPSPGLATTSSSPATVSKT